MWKPSPAGSVGSRSKRFQRSAELRSRSAVGTCEPGLLQVAQLVILVLQVKFRSFIVAQEQESGLRRKRDPPSAKTIASLLKLLIQLFQACSVRVYGLRLVPAQCDSSSLFTLFEIRNAARQKKTQRNSFMFSIKSTLVFPKSNLRAPTDLDFNFYFMILAGRLAVGPRPGQA